MIKTQIQCYTNSYTFDGEIIVPSRVLTSNPQEEEFDLSYTPNFTIKLNDAYSYLNDTVELSFSYGNNEYTAYANVINRNAGVTTLQYSYGLTTTYVEPTPVVHTLAFDYDGSGCECDTNGDVTGTSNVWNLLYDNEAVNLSEDSTVQWDGLTIVSYEPARDGETDDAIGYFWYPQYDGESAAGEYTAYVSATYNELTAYCQVPVTFTEPAPAADPVVAYLKFGGGVPATSDEPNDYTDNTDDNYEPRSGFSILFVDENGNNISSDVSNYIIDVTASDDLGSVFNPSCEWVSWENENYPDEGAVVISSSNYEGDVSDMNAHNMGWLLTINTDTDHYLLWDPVAGESEEGEAESSVTFVFGAGSVW